MQIALVFGGSSFEHEISIVSAITLKKVIKDNLKFIFIDPNRDIFLIEPSDMKSNFFSSKEYLKKSKRVTLQNGGFFIDGLLGKKKKIEFDIALNVIHGRDGEDGKLASLFDFYKIKYIGPRVEGSVVSYNKIFTKCLAENLDINVIDYEVLDIDSPREIGFEFPVIIKPARLGSSIGVSIVKSQDELDYALDVAFEFDTQVLVEPFIEGIKEYNLAGAFAKEWILSTIEEPQKEEFLDFDKKYLDFSRDEQVNEAQIDNELKEKLEETFKAVYSPLFCGAIIRCDFFVINNSIYLNEINPIPGSLANYLFEDFNEVLNKIATNLPTEKNINIDYLYINNIQKAKGKA